MFVVDPRASQSGGGLCESRDHALYVYCFQAPCMLLNIKQVLVFSKHVGSAFSVRHGMGGRALLLPAGWVTSSNEFTLMAQFLYLSGGLEKPALIYFVK